MQRGWKQTDIKYCELERQECTFPEHITNWVEQSGAVGKDGRYLSMSEKREFMKMAQTAAAKKENGGLGEARWKRYKTSVAGFTDDVIRTELLETYEPMDREHNPWRYEKE